MKMFHDNAPCPTIDKVIEAYEHARGETICDHALSALFGFMFRLNSKPQRDENGALTIRTVSLHCFTKSWTGANKPDTCTCAAKFVEQTSRENE